MSQIFCPEVRSVIRLPPALKVGREEGTRALLQSQQFWLCQVSQQTTELLLVWPLPLIWLHLGSHPPKRTVLLFCTCSMSFRQMLLIGSICHVWVGRKHSTQRTIAAGICSGEIL